MERLDCTRLVGFALCHSIKSAGETIHYYRNRYVELDFGIQSMCVS